MPRWLRRFLVKRSLRYHFAVALILGALARVLSAYFVYGPQALDDYKHGVWPAYQYFADIPLDLPAYRSHLLVWFLSGFVKIASWFEMTSALAQVRAMYFGLGLTSLVGIYGTFLYVSTFRSRLFGALALYLVALFPIMPFVSTRAFGEAVALGLVLLGLGILEHARKVLERKKSTWILGFTYFLGFAVFGLAVLFRFHVGLVFVTYALLLLISRRWIGVASAVVAGVFTLFGQALIDILSGKSALGTLFIYLKENEGGAARYGVSPWYNPLLFILAVSLAPFSVVLWGAGGSLWRRHKFMLLPFLVFVVAHSLVAHKEERFIYPVLGLELWALAHLWAANSYNRFSRRFFSPAILLLSALLLPAVCLINSQEGEIEPPALVERQYGQVIYLDHRSLFGQSRFRFYFLRPPSELHEVEAEDLNLQNVDQRLQASSKHKAVVLLTSEAGLRNQLEAMAGTKGLVSQCLNVRASGSLIDRLIYSLNPRHNQRRRPTWYLVCERSLNA